MHLTQEPLAANLTTSFIFSVLPFSLLVRRDGGNRPWEWGKSVVSVGPCLFTSLAYHTHISRWGFCQWWLFFFFFVDWFLIRFDYLPSALHRCHESRTGFSEFQMGLSLCQLKSYSVLFRKRSGVNSFLNEEEISEIILINMYISWKSRCQGLRTKQVLPLTDGCSMDVPNGLYYAL